MKPSLWKVRPREFVLGDELEYPRVSDRAKRLDRVPDQRLSAKLEAKTFAAAVRAHWGVENRLHWVLDVVFTSAASFTKAKSTKAGIRLPHRL